MRAYTDYAYYKDIYKGAYIPEAVFDKIAAKASRYIDSFTFGRMEGSVGEYPALLDCVCDMAEKIYAAEGMSGNVKEKKSENTDGYDVTYVTDSVDGGNAAAALEKKLYAVANMYLGSTGLLYFGVDEC